MMKIMMMIIVVEALTQLIFEAAPLQPIRNFIIRFTPFLNIGGSHLLECKYCTSVWVSMFSVFLYYNLDYQIVYWFCLMLVFHRLSNFVHLYFSLMRDIQLDKRASRN